MQLIFYPQFTQMKVTSENILLIVKRKLEGNLQCVKNHSYQKTPKPNLSKQNNPTTKPTNNQKREAQIPPKLKHPSRLISFKNLVLFTIFNQLMIVISREKEAISKETVSYIFFPLTNDPALHLQGTEEPFHSGVHI